MDKDLKRAVVGLAAALREAIGPDSLLGEKALYRCYCDDPDEEAGESGTIECDGCRARREVKAIAAALSRYAPGQGRRH